MEIFPPRGFTRSAVSWVGATAESIESAVSARCEFHYRAPVHLLIMYEQGSRLSGESFIEGLPASKLRDFTHKFSFVPAGREFLEWLVLRTRMRMTCIYLDPAKLDVPVLPVTESAFAPRLFFEDTILWQTVLKLKTLLNEAPENQLYFEAVGTVLAHEIIISNRRAISLPQLRGGLAAWQMRLVSAYIEEHLAEQMRLPTLAALARLSPWHFCRAFKQSFGLPPHRYHINRRIDRAKHLLSDPDFSVTEIALSLGFSETSSFTAAFRRATGITPTGYHRSLSTVGSAPKFRTCFSGADCRKTSAWGGPRAYDSEWRLDDGGDRRLD